MTRSTPIALLLAAAALAQAPTPPRRKPKLVLAVIADQFRLDYLYRFRDNYSGGLSRMLTQGAVFTNAYYEHSYTVTAIGHSTFMSGATPSISGIVANDWYDRQSGKAVTSVSDTGHKMVGATGDGSSPRRLLVSTLGDELKMAGRGKPKAIGISIKDRSAILPVGHMADGAFWFDNKTGNFVSSTYYFADALPSWTGDFNKSRAVDKYMGAEWRPIDNPKAEPFQTMLKEPTDKYWGEMQRTPFGNEIVEALAERAFVAEKLGQRNEPLPDLLAVSFSSNDYIGHDYGPDDPRVRDISIRTDRLLGKLFQFLEAKVGMANVLVVFSADHGVAPIPRVNNERKMPGGTLGAKAILAKLDERLDAVYGRGEWFPRPELPAIYVNRNLIAHLGLDAARVRARIASWLREEAHVQRVYTWDQLADGRAGSDPIDLRVRNSFNAERGPDIYLVLDPYWLPEPGKGTTHGTPYSYDAHVPVMFLGPGVKAGFHHGKAAPNDIAPTLATMLEVERPSGALGRVLEEMLR